MIDFKSLLKAALEGETLDWLASQVAPRFGYLARANRHRYYFGLAGLFLVAIAGNVAWKAVRTEVSGQSLDLAIKARLSSPKPDPSIVILDIDERSLASLAPNHGRWPWPRTVLAEAIASLADAGAAAIVVNVMLSDADQSNPQADATFEAVAAATPNAVFPVVRLNPANDAQSAVRVSMLPHARISDPSSGDNRIALLAPWFPGTHGKLGINNLAVDADGVVRRYAVWWPGQGYALPSIAYRAAALKPEGRAQEAPDSIVLNWRNKRGDYTRVPFADFYLAVSNGKSFPLEKFRDAIVIVGVSAPGLAHTRGTASASTMDDNVIIATAIDDTINGTHLRLLPDWVIGLISALLVIVLAVLFTKGVKDKKINSVFGVAQGGLVAITIGSASFSVYLVDLSQCLVISIAYFFTAKLYSVVQRNALRGTPTFARIGAAAAQGDRLVTFALNSSTLDRAKLGAVQEALERRFGIDRTFQIDNAFGDGNSLFSGNLFSSVFSGSRFLVVFLRHDELVERTHELAAARELFRKLTADLGITYKVVVRNLPPAAAEDISLLQREVAQAILEAAKQMIATPAH